MTKRLSVKHLFLPHHSNNQRARLLHPTGLTLVLAVVLVMQLVMRQSSYVMPSILGYASQIPSSEIITLTNAERQQRGLPILTLNSELTKAAEKKAADMFAKDYWAHVSPIGTQPWFFITEAGYTYRYAGENLARDFSDPQSVVKAWIASPSHRENVLNNRYQDIGVAVVDGKLGGHETTLVVQMFGTKLSSQTAPSVSRTGSTTVKAAEPASVKPATLGSVAQPATSPFEISKYFAIIVLFLLAAVLLIDVILVNRKNLVRWTSKSVAHFIFVVVIITATAAILRGQIL